MMLEHVSSLEYTHAHAHARPHVHVHTRACTRIHSRFLSFSRFWLIFSNMLTDLHEKYYSGFKLSEINYIRI